MNDFSETARDMDTFRPIIAPMSGPDDDADRPLPSKWFGLSIVLGALVGTLIVAWVYIEDHPVVPTVARHATNAVSAPVTAPVAAAPVAAAPIAAAAPVAAHGGFIAIPGPAGTRVFDGNAFVGIAPMLYATNAGPHIIRVSSVDKSQTFNVEVRSYETTAVVASFGAIASKSLSKRRAAAPPAAKKSR